MMWTDLPETGRMAVTLVAAMVAGGVNSLAGGGTLIVFPVLLALGVPPVMASATTTVGLLPGALGSMWGFRAQLAQVKRRIYTLMIPAALGGALGAGLLTQTSAEAFRPMVPWLILFATGLFVLQGPLQQGLAAAWPRGWSFRRRWWIMAMAVQLLAAIYGGYFGAGMSIIMLSVLALIGMKDMLQMSGLTSVLALCVNAVASAIFVAAGMVDGSFLGALWIGAAMGGYGATLVAHKVGPAVVRKWVVAIGLSLGLLMLWELQWR